MASSKTHSVVVSYINHADANTKGTMTVATDNVADAINTTVWDLRAQNEAEGFDVSGTFVTITKAVLEDQPLFPYAGHRASF